jgi:uncharacterized protein with gpF-like domain
VKTLRSGIDPARNALVENVARDVVEGAGIAWDVSSPFVGHVLAQAGAHVAHIADTTRINLMEIIRTAHEEGLSVAQTAALIRRGMTAAAPARAELIARSELTAAANGGALAGVRVVQAATGQTYTKSWLATDDERTRATHADADGQTVPLADQFTVGGEALDCPGDPNGSAAETAACRCALTFSEQAPEHLP